jgi:3-methylfumaryl-CoA hydratase
MSSMLEPGEAVGRVEACSVVAVRRVAAMLDLDPSGIVEGDPLPRGWQFLMLGADTKRSDLRGDGFPGLGVPMPDLGLPRLLLGGRTVSYLADIPIGATLHRASSVESLKRKSTESGPLAILTILHELRITNTAMPAIIETQTYLLQGAQKRFAQDVNVGSSAPISADRTMVFVPDETLLFQYSALGFNTHKIHIDRSYARDVEGYPDLVVNGGLTTLLLTEFLRRDLCLIPAAIKVRHIAPLFCRRAITFAATRNGETWNLKAFNETGRLAVDMEVETA